MHSLTSYISYVQSIFGTGTLGRDNVNFAVRCPICDPSDRAKKKLIVHLPTGMYHCWTCGARSRSLYGLIKKYGSELDLRRYKEEFMSDEQRAYFTHVDESDLEVEVKEVVTLPDDFTLLVLAPDFDPDVVAAWKYLSSRGLSEHDAWRYKIGVSNEFRWKRRLIVPSFDNEGKLNYFVARNIDEFDRRSKYDNPNENKSSIIFNEINVDWSKQLVLCEGAFDMMKCGANVVPLLGSDLNPESKLFFAIVTNSTPIALALDGDMWETKVHKVNKLLQQFNVDVTVLDLREWSDPGSMTKTQFKHELDNSRPLVWEDSILSKISKLDTMSLRVRSA